MKVLRGEVTRRSNLRSAKYDEPGASEEPLYAGSARQ